jgi:hypothetical protein
MHNFNSSQKLECFNICGIQFYISVDMECMVTFHRKKRGNNFVTLNFGNQIIDFHHIGNLNILQFDVVVFEDNLQRFYVILVHGEGLVEWLC